MKSGDEDNDFTLSARTSVMGSEPEKITLQRQGCVRDLQGRIAVTLAYFAFAFMYVLTVFYGIWDLHEADYS